MIKREEEREREREKEYIGWLSHCRMRVKGSHKMCPQSKFVIGIRDC